MKQSGPAHNRYLLSSLVLVLCRILVTLGGFVVVAALTARFGAGVLSDAYFIARLIPITLLSSLGIAFNLAFVPVYMRAAAAPAATLASGFLNATWMTSGLLTLVYLLFADAIVELLAPGFTPEAHAAAVWMTRIMAPAILLTSVHAVFDSLLNARRRFVASALSSLSVPTGALLGVSLFAERWGVTGLAGGALAGFVVQAAVLLPVVRPYFSGRPWSLPRLTPDIRQAAWFLALAAFVMAGWQVNLLIDRMFASLLGAGAITALSLGTVLVGLVPIIFAASVYKVVYPELVRLAQEQRHAEMLRLLNRNFVLVTFFTLPVATSLMLFAPEVTQLAFGYGNFADAAANTSQVIFYGAIGLPAAVSGMLLIFFFLVTRNVRVVVGIFVATIAAKLLLNWLLMESMGIGGIALATSLLSLLRTWAMALLAGRCLGGSLTNGLWLPALKSAVASGGALALMFALWSMLPPSLQQGSPRELLLGISLAGAAGASLYLVTSLIVRHEGLQWLLGRTR